MVTFGKKAKELAIKRVKQDVKDDFWPDIFDYDDYLDDLKFVASTNYNKYSPAQLITLDIPKPTLVLRPGQFIRLTDRIYYQLLVEKFFKKVDSALMKRNVVFSHRASINGRHMFENGVEAWKRFNSKSETLFNKQPSGFLLKTDISAYFEHIKIKKLCSILGQLGANAEVVSRLQFLLHAWHEGGIGIPQGYDVSSFLGNVYLHEVDEVMIAEKFNYYRFADDIRVFATEEKEIQRAIAKLTELFRPLNLHLAGGKTRVLNRESYFASANEFSDEMEAISYGLDIGTFDERKLSNLKKLWAVATKSKVDKTMLNFCINRFKKLKSDYPLNSIIKRNLFDPSFSSVIIAYLELFIDRKRVQLILLSTLGNSSYDYQKILILRALIKAARLHFSIAQIDKEAIYKSNNFMLIGYYFILCGKFGTPGIRTAIKNKFSGAFNSDEKISRYFLAAISYFPNKKDEINELLRTRAYLVPTAKYIAANEKKIFQ